MKNIIRKFLPRTKQRHKILSGPLQGNYIITSWHDYPAGILGYTESQLVEWFDKNVNPGETWLDVGAHYGYLAIALGKFVGTKGRVFAFEPSISTAGYLVQTRVKNNLRQLTVVPFGLGGLDDLEILALPFERGMLDSTKDGSDWLETLFVSRLDWLWPKICGENKNIDGIKIDVQGMEIDVLSGMSRVLQTHKPKLIIELHKGVDRDEFLRQIKSSGYSTDAISLVADEQRTVNRLLDDTSYVFLPIRP